MSQPLKRLWGGCLALTIGFIALVSLLPHEGRIQPKKPVADAIDYALANHSGHHYLVDYDFSAQVIYLARGQLPFFIDSRADTAYSARTLKDYLAFRRLTPGWQEKIKAYGINGIIISNESAFAEAYADGQFQKEWKLAFAGKHASVYIALP